MLQKHLQFSLAFLFIFIFQMAIEVDPKTAKLILEQLHYIVKPLITISLLGYLIYHSQFKGRFSKRIGIGLLFGLIGDVLLMFTSINEVFFMGGLIAFLIGHLAYISAFYLDYSWAKGIEKLASLLALVFFGLFSIAFYLYLYPYLGDMKIAVLAYSLVITIMAIMAVSRKGRVNTLSYKLIFWGALLFVISDSFLAYHKFIGGSKYTGAIIMAAYMIAQYVITIGAIERKMRKHSMITKKS